MTTLVAKFRIIVGALALLALARRRAPGERRSNRPRSIRQASAVKEEQLLQRVQHDPGPRAPSPIRRPARSSSRPAAIGAISTR